jgi:hypothetical protein
VTKQKKNGRPRPPVPPCSGLAYYFLPCFNDGIADVFGKFYRAIDKVSFQLRPEQLDYVVSLAAAMAASRTAVRIVRLVFMAPPENWI